MNKEKIVLGNATELEIDSINYQGNALVIGFAGSNIADLEQTFRSAGQDNLEQIQQLDAEGNEQAVHERYDIFREIRKTIANDVVEVVLEQEGMIDMKIRHLEARTGANEEVIDSLVMESLS